MGIIFVWGYYMFAPPHEILCQASDLLERRLPAGHALIRHPHSQQPLT